jgi:hypothetical protein
LASPRGESFIVVAKRQPSLRRRYALNRLDPRSPVNVYANMQPEKSGAHTRGTPLLLMRSINRPYVPSAGQIAQPLWSAPQ